MAKPEQKNPEGGRKPADRDRIIPMDVDIIPMDVDLETASWTKKPENAKKPPPPPAPPPKK